MEVTMKKFLTLLLVFTTVLIFSTTTFNIDVAKGTYTGLVYNCKYESNIVFDLSSDTSDYSIRIDIYSLSGKYLFNIWDKTPVNHKVTWNALTPDYQHLKPGVYLVYFQKKDSTGKILKEFFLPLLAAIDLKK